MLSQLTKSSHLMNLNPAMFRSHFYISPVCIFMQEKRFFARENSTDKKQKYFEIPSFRKAPATTPPEAQDEVKCKKSLEISPNNPTQTENLKIEKFECPSGLTLKEKFWDLLNGLRALNWKELFQKFVSLLWLFHPRNIWNTSVRIKENVVRGTEIVLASNEYALARQYSIQMWHFSRAAFSRLLIWIQMFRESREYEILKRFSLIALENFIKYTRLALRTAREIYGRNTKKSDQQK